MPGFASPRASIKGVVSEKSYIYGHSEIGERTFIDENVTIGYPSRQRLLKAIEEFSGNVSEVLDKASLGSFVGSGCIIRRGCCIYDEVMIESDIEIGHNVLIRSGTVIRKGSKIGSYTVLDGSVLIGMEVNIQSNVYMPHLTKVMDKAFIGPGTIMTNDPYPVASPLKGPTIGVGAVIGAGVVILPGLEIGDGAVVGAGSLVTKNVPPNSVVYGVPAKYVYDIKEYKRKKQLYDRRGGGS